MKPAGRPLARDYAEVAHVARHALANGHRPARAVADHFGITEAAANSAISRARQHGHPVPSALGRTINGAFVAFATPPVDDADFVPPTPRPGLIHACDDCGHLAGTGWELAAHTLETHGRTLTATERAPRAVEVAA